MSKPSSTTPPPAKRSWLARSVARIFSKKKKSAPATAKPVSDGRPVALTKAETALLPPFPGLPLEHIHVPRTAEECEAAAQAILAAGVAGFDTESRPTFKAGETSTGPHVVQFALTDHAYLFLLRHAECRRTAADLIASTKVLKVGFGLANDHGQINRRLGTALHHVLDLDHEFRRRGYKGQIGVRGAIGAVLGQGFPKSKSTSTSNWAAATLMPRQMLYAANDAFAALKIMEALKLDPTEVAKRLSKPPRPRRSRKERPIRPVQDNG